VQSTCYIYVAAENAQPLGDDTDMKTTIEIDFTPEEARRLFGLPDVTKVNELCGGSGGLDSYRVGIS
jgi:hypothetical protein